MSTTTTSDISLREVGFAVGTFLGMASFAFGVATLVLAMSVGLRRGQEYLPPGVRMALTVGGSLLFLVGAVVRLYRRKISATHEDRLAIGGVIAALLGAAAVLFGTAAETTVSAPFLATSTDKMLLFVFAYVLIALGLVILRATARIVGW